MVITQQLITVNT
ncbi:hypothetical protein FWK35_00031149 [Aphis craccivora]|uniref:Uncharacterized protein n=1 Tax=Aphis craccivora TaxID=307492 RepID=A0A6G0VXV3_APHCR|nr:hypothetical protein FWK35_00031149 [Aphis craccivora]